VTLEMSMADREVYLKEHPNMEQVLLTMPPLLDPFFMGRLNDSAKSFQKNVLGKMKETIPGTIQRRKVNLKIILANIFSAVKAHGKKEVWNHIAIGSDFDGMIVPFETYANSAQLDDLAQDLYQFLSKPAPIFDLFIISKFLLS
jgi:hypothetical protein